MTAPAPGTTLAIVERAHRGAVEQQYAHVLWLVHGLHRQSPMTLLLRGGAAVYALAGAPPGPVVLAGRPSGVYPDYQNALARLRADGGAILVSLDSLTTLGLADRALLAGVEVVSDDQIADVAAGARRIWFL